MDLDDAPCAVSAPIGKKRIPVKCDGKRPCTRCKRSRKRCVFFEIPKDPAVERLENVEAEVQRLRGQLGEMHELLRLYSQSGDNAAIAIPSPTQVMSDPGTMPAVLAEGSGGFHRGVRYGLNHRNGEVLRFQAARPARQRRSGFDIREEPISDFISRGLMTVDEAMSCFRTYVYMIDDRYIPVFDPALDTFTSVRARSSILLNAICTIGSRVETSSGSRNPDLLHAELKRSISVVIQNKSLNCLESVQALLIVACYSAERSLILSFAARMALDLGLDEAFEELIQRLTMKETEVISDRSATLDEEERTLMRKSRTWFGLLVLDHIFHVDGGKPPGIRMTGNAHRSRILLRHGTSTVLDLRLFSQVELNVIRAKINDTLDAKETLERPDVPEFVHEAKVDLDLWFDDWLRIIENSSSAEQERPFLLAALRVQKCWAELILHCQALRSMGVENVAAMSPIERTLLLTAKSSARKHLRLISLEPDFYLAKLKYAMDFVWAKCAFCFLLLLKLSRLLPERKEEHQELLDHGNRLLDELTRSTTPTSTPPQPLIPPGPSTGIGSGAGAGTIYMQILRLSIEKYSRILQRHQVPSAVPGISSEEAESEAEVTTTTAPPTPFWELFDAQTDLQSFIPEQFVREWDFPGLDLFYFPTAWQDFFGDFSSVVV
ncbi:putative C6 transcription factor [Aspergillus ibericus CBS 121593]|uniref:C6 zinc finger domain protein n=1 Tax=Aspergillus ibericus CBS 121593 TaxID=1448316 RepID=A0A395GS75_9EURO|nr:C6 zinc finger domain protein [Aspergillus ibericus CBS 121593]RAK98430.1 C6 zinc finger domain protein [Aspergillus ibericus CBS 121593]